MLPIKLIRLGKHGQNYSRPIKAVFGSLAEVFDILKSKKKFSSLQPPSTIGISSDRTIYQRNYIKPLREKLESCRSNDKFDLIITYVKGSLIIVSKLSILVTIHTKFYLKYFLPKFPLVF